MPVPKFGWVVLALVAVLRAVGWARTRDSQNGNAPAASETGKTVHETAQDNKPSKNEVNEDGPDLEVKELRFDELEARLPTMEPGPERDYFTGVLANATGRFTESIRLLNSVLPVIRTSRPDRAAVALEDLADDYTKSFQYADAVRADDDLLAHFSSQLKPEELQGTKNDVGVMQILREAPAQTIEWNGPTILKTERNPMNSLNVELTVNGMQAPWLLDTGANISVVSQSFAERLGLKLLAGNAQTTAGLASHPADGRRNPAQCGGDGAERCEPEYQAGQRFIPDQWNNRLSRLSSAGDGNFSPQW
jgi:hypothetical protein